VQDTHGSVALVEMSERVLAQHHKHLVELLALFDGGSDADALTQLSVGGRAPTDQRELERSATRSIQTQWACERSQRGKEPVW
jgi:hypothetical protein